MFKIYKISAKKYRGVMSHGTEEWCKIWKKNYSKNDKNFVNFDPSTQKSQKYVLSNIGPFCSKYIKFDLKEHWGVIFHDTEETCKIWRKTELWFGKWQEEFFNFSPEHVTVSKLVLSFCPM